MTSGAAGALPDAGTVEADAMVANHADAPGADLETVSDTTKISTLSRVTPSPLSGATARAATTGRKG